MAAVCLWLNRRLPGILFIGAGGLLNGVTITLNGGTLPASSAALQSSGHAAAPGEFANSAVLPDAKLATFGDIFATPSWLPGHNVFSLGDVMIWLGLAWNFRHGETLPLAIAMAVPAVIVLVGMLLPVSVDALEHGGRREGPGD